MLGCHLPISWVYHICALVAGRFAHGVGAPMYGKHTLQVWTKFETTVYSKLIFGKLNCPAWKYVYWGMIYGWILLGNPRVSSGSPCRWADPWHLRTFQVFFGSTSNCGEKKTRKTNWMVWINLGMCQTWETLKKWFRNDQFARLKPCWAIGPTDWVISWSSFSKSSMASKVPPGDHQQWWLHGDLMRL